MMRIQAVLMGKLLQKLVQNCFRLYRKYFDIKAVRKILL